MSENRSFSENISGLRRRFLIRGVSRTAAAGLVVFLCCRTLAAGFETAGILLFSRSTVFYAVSTAVSVFVSLCLARLKRKHFMAFLIDLDCRLDLKDTISTAYEYHRLHKPSRLKNRLLEDASDKLSRLGGSRLFTSRYSAIHALLVLLILANGVIFFADRISWVSRQANAGPERLEELAGTAANSPESRKKDFKRLEKEKNTRTPSPPDKLESLAKKLNAPSMTRKEILTALNEMLEEIQSDESLLSKETRSTPRGDRVRGLPIRKFQRYGQSSLNRMKNLFQAMFTDGIPEKIETNPVLQAEYRRLEKVLSQLIDRMEGAAGGGSVAGRTGAQSKPDPTRGKNPQKGGRNKKTDDGREKTPADDSRSGEQRAGSAQSGSNPPDPGGLDDYGQEDEATSLMAGSARSSGREKPPYELAGKKTPAVQDKVVSAKTDDYRVHIRSLTHIGKAEINAEKIDRDNRQELEGILKKEDIPLNYREYIRNYFISIGMRK